MASSHMPMRRRVHVRALKVVVVVMAAQPEMVQVAAVAAAVHQAADVQKPPYGTNINSTTKRAMERAPWCGRPARVRRSILVLRTLLCARRWL